MKKEFTKEEIEKAFFKTTELTDKKEQFKQFLDILGIVNHEDSAKQLDLVCQPFFEGLEKEYNKWSIKKHESFNINSQKEITFAKINKNVKNVHSYSNNLHAFTLKHINAGQVTYETVKLEDTNAILGRILIGYSLASRILHSKDPSLLLPSVKALINEITETLGFSHDKLNCGTYLTFKRPGYNSPTYFVEDVNHAAYELRIFSDAILAE